jgi:hypothetical protein
MNALFIICWIIVFIAVWRFYHKMFNVAYFGFNALVKEIIGIGVVSMFLGAILAAIIGGIFIH